MCAVYIVTLRACIDMQLYVVMYAELIRLKHTYHVVGNVKAHLFSQIYLHMYVYSYIGNLLIFA